VTFGRLVLALALLAALFSVACGLIVADGLCDRPGPADVGVVMGSLARPDGTPGPGLAARLDRGLAAWREGLVPRLIVSGGFDRGGVNEVPGMRRYLLERGVPDSCLITDPRGQNTWLTARNTRAWMDARGLRRVLVVSEYYHLPRCRLAFARHGLRGVFTLHARHVGARDLFATAREVPALVKYALRRDY
jgi:vancomycin permeability regulator SanA